MKKVIVAFLLISVLARCVSKEKQIVGTWKTDSISNFVNGFTHTNDSQDEHWSHSSIQKRELFLSAGKRIQKIQLQNRGFGFTGLSGFSRYFFKRIQNP